MADFRPAFDFMMKHEDPQLSGIVTTDTGGKTRFGIAEKHNIMPSVFWQEPRQNALNRAATVYYQKYWIYGKLVNQNIANKVFDMSVNMGPHVSHRILQACLNIQQYNLYVDGKWGTKTESACNQASAVHLLTDLQSESATFYTNLAEQNPEKYKIYLKGWLNRARA